MDENDPLYKEDYSFIYDAYGNRTASNVGVHSLVTYSYMPGNGVLERVTYGNGDGIRYVYDCWGNDTEVWKFDGNGSDEKAFSWTYDSAGTLLTYTDYENREAYVYGYDSIGRLIRQDVSDLSGTPVSSAEYTYDLMNNVTTVTVSAGGETHTQHYDYRNTDNLADSFLIGNDDVAEYTYDALNRLTGRTLSMGNGTVYNNYIYKSSGRNTGTSTTYTTTLVSEEYVGNTAYRYTYDANGNITAIEKGTRTNAGTKDRNHCAQCVYP